MATRKRQRLKRRIRLLEQRVAHLSQEISRKKSSFDQHVEAHSKEINELGADALDRREINAYRLLIYLEVIDYAKIIQVIVNYGSKSNTPFILLRGMLEAVADLRNLSRAESTLDDLKLRYHKGRRVVLTNARAGNQYLQGISTGEELDALIQDQADAIEALEAAGATTKQIEQRFSDAGMSAEYDGWYRFFSEFVHRGLKIIENRYFEQDGKGNWIFPPDLNKPWMEVDIDRFQATMGYLLKDARKELLDNGILTD